MKSGGETAEARILAIAGQHLRRDGLRRLTIVRVAEEAGMTHANVYRYFRSKTDLADQLLGEWLRDLEQGLTEITQSPDPADDKLERFLTLLARAYLAAAREEPALFLVLTDALDARRIAGLRHRQRVRDLMLRIIEEGASTRLFAGGDIRRLQQLVLDLMHRFVDPHAIQLGLKTEAGTLEGRRERATRMTLRGLMQGR
jgi:AcrR family transcriptional regulator